MARVACTGGAARPPAFDLPWRRHFCLPGRDSELLISGIADELTWDRATEHLLAADEPRSTQIRQGKLLIGVHPCLSAAKFLPRLGIEFDRSAARQTESGGSIRFPGGAGKWGGHQEFRDSSRPSREVASSVPKRRAVFESVVSESL
jgi:hypothetical protein